TCAGRVEPRLRVRRTEPQCGVERRDGLLRPTEVEEALALPPVRKVSALRRAADRGIVVGQCFVGAAERGMDVGPEEKGLGAELRIALHGLQGFHLPAGRVKPARELE